MIAVVGVERSARTLSAVLPDPYLRLVIVFVDGGNALTANVCVLVRYAPYAYHGVGVANNET